MSLYEYDYAVIARSGALIAGVDEAGRGPLAGSVYAAAVILPYDFEIVGINDSKKLTEKRREKLYDEIRSRAVSFYIASASPAEIDVQNILQASLLAMRRAVAGLSLIPKLVLVDGTFDPNCEVLAETVVKGDSISAAIAAASILAKVARDRYMQTLDAQYPDYAFAKHKGYPTKLHYAMLDQHGPCPEHRETFLRKWRASNR